MRYDGVDELVEYVKDKHGHRRGVMVAWKIHDTDDRGDIIPKFYFGWSLCHKRLDKFNRDTGLFLARGRALSLDPLGPIYMPHSICDTAERFYYRARKFFLKNEPTCKEYQGHGLTLRQFIPAPRG